MSAPLPRRSRATAPSSMLFHHRYIVLAKLVRYYREAGPADSCKVRAAVETQCISAVDHARPAPSIYSLPYFSNPTEIRNHRLARSIDMVSAR